MVNQLNEQNLNNIAAQDPRLSLAIHEGKKISNRNCNS
ncbi:MafB silent cassette [Neisseria lactamica 020-06]|uniref:MafB silent cassette n=1 Tax=Neisseria lactamica (strain 020-06) TaxID=489653 RepID=E4ZAI3_NEIL0|nr:MafB silent cassette [Neisseria lactamica 020-06]